MSSSLQIKGHFQHLIPPRGRFASLDLGSSAANAKLLYLLSSTFFSVLTLFEIKVASLSGKTSTMSRVLEDLLALFHV